MRPDVTRSVCESKTTVTARIATQKTDSAIDAT